MLIHHGDARTKTSDRLLAWSLAGIAGAVNAAGFHAAGRYVSHMTGTVAVLAEELAVGDLVNAAGSLGILFMFVAGAATSALLVGLGMRRGLRGIYAYNVLAEGVLLAGLAAADMALAGAWRGPLLLAGLAFLMGLQNAIVTRLSGARIRTTHVTGMVTDIGIELGHLLDRTLRRGGPEATAPDRDKLALHLPTVASFVAGGVLGAVGYRGYGPLSLLVPSACLVALALRGLSAAPDTVPTEPSR